MSRIRFDVARAVAEARDLANTSAFASVGAGISLPVILEIMPDGALEWMTTAEKLFGALAVVMAVFALLVMQGCATLMPDAIPIEATHVSHISQHFGPHPTNYGYNAFYAGLKWERGDWSLKLEEGYVAGRLDGMHEVSEVSIEYDIPLHR